MAEQDAKFLQGSLLKHITEMSLTASLGLLALFIVDLVDMLFISMLGVPELAAAVGFAGSLLFFTTSISIGVSIAAGALVAKSLGQGNALRARELMTHVMIIGFVVAVFVAGLVWMFLEDLIALLGASGETSALALGYLQIIIPSMPFLMCGMVAAAALRSHGAARLSMAATLAAGFVNAILDPLFIFGFGWGLDGAAWASVVARFAMVAVALWPIFKIYGGFAGLSVPAVVRDIKPIAAIAFPAILANVATPIGSAYVTRVSSNFGEEAVAGMAVIGRLTPVAFALIFALSGAIGPIMGQNFGAEKFDRVRKAFNEALIFITVYVCVVVVILFALRGAIAAMFGVEGVAKDLVFLFCGPLSLAWIFNGVIFVGNAAYNNLGHPFYSTWINWGRNTIGVVPFVYFGAQFWGAQGVLIGQMAGGVIVAMISWWLALRTIEKARHIERPKEKAASSFHERSFKIFNHRR